MQLSPAKSKVRSIKTCTRKLTFEAGHRVMGHEGKCSHLHGHSYGVEIEAEQEHDPEGLDGIGRVVDFSVLKERVGAWIDANWDHGFILSNDDKKTACALNELSFSQRIFLLPGNPTAENIADYLLRVVCPNELVGTGARVIRVTVQETANCRAEACLF